MHWWTPRRTSQAMVVLVVLATLFAGCLGGDGDNGNGNGDEKEEVIANAGPDVFGQVGQPVAFNASASSGPIATYSWNVDSGNLSTSQPIILTGEVVNHTYTVAGVYLVTLTVEGDKGQNSTDTLTARIDLRENVTGHLSASPNELNETYTRAVGPDAQKIVLTLEYPSDIQIVLGTVPVYLDMDVFIGGGLPVASTTGQQRDTGDTQEETLEVPVTQAVDNEGFRVVVRWQGAPVGSVDFTLHIDIYYHAV